MEWEWDAHKMVVAMREGFEQEVAAFISVWKGRERGKLLREGKGRERESEGEVKRKR